MKLLIPFFVGVCVGFGASQWLGKSHGPGNLRDVVSFSKSNLGDLVRGIGTVMDGQGKYVSSTGGMALDCEESDTCSLAVPTGKGPQLPAVPVVGTPQVVHVRPTGPVHQQPSTPSPLDAMETLQTKMGLRSGDVIMSINGSPVDSPSQALTEISSIIRRKEDLREVVVMRDRTPVRLVAR